MNKEKFMIYKIKVVYNDGTVEYRNEQGYSTASYEDMKSLYEKVKEEVCDKDCKIVLLGVNFRGANRSLKEADFTKSSTEEKKIYETSFKEYAEQIQDALKKMRMKRDYHRQVLDTIEKKDSIMDHRIETFNKKKWDKSDEMLEEKIKIFDELETIKSERRYHKNELEVIFGIRDRIDLKDVYEAFTVKSIDCKYKYLDENMVKSLGIMQEVYYSTEKERVHKVRKFKEKYDKVKVDVKNRKITCYNKSTRKV